MNRLTRMIKTSSKYINRNSGLAFSTIIVVFIAFFILSIFGSLFMLSEMLFNALEQQVGLILYFRPDVAEDDILEFKTDVEANYPSVVTSYWSKEDVFNYYDQEIYHGRADEFVDENMLTPTLRIASSEISDIEEINNTAFSDADFSAKIQDYDYSDQAVGFLRKATQGIFWGGIALSILLLISSFVIIMITTDISIENHREEIKTMQLIGADRDYIRWPFVVAGGICSFVGALLALILFGVGAFLVYRSMVDQGVVTFIKDRLFPGAIWPQIKLWYFVAVAGGELLLGWVIGALSSFLSVKRRLKW